MVEAVTSTVQRNFLIQQYCSDRFVFVNMVDVYYRIYKSNAIFALFLNLIIFLMFWNIFPPVIYRMLCPSVLETIKSLKLSLVTASITVTAVINAMPSFYTYTRQEKHASKTVINNLQWILAETLIILNLAIGIIAIVSEKTLVLSKWIFVKDSLFILGTLCLFIIYGFAKEINYAFVIILFSIFGAFLVLTVLADLKRKETESLEALQLEQMEEQDQQDTGKHHDEELVPVSANGKEPAAVVVAEEEDDIDDDLPKAFNWSKFIKEIEEEVTFTDSGFIMNCILVPPMCLALLSIPYYKNPLMRTPIKYLVFFLGSSIILFNFHLRGISTAYRFFFSFIVAGVYMTFNLINFNQTVIDYLTEFMGYLSAISYTHILLLFCLDSLAFLGFYFSGNEILIYNFWPATLSGLFVLFTAIGYAVWGKSLLGIYSCYASIITLITLYFGIVCLTSINENEQSFELFSFDATQFKDFLTPEKISTYVLLGLFAITNIGQTIYFWNNQFRITKTYGIVTVAAYVLFIVGVSFWGLYRGNGEIQN
jgi:hypothetical protein